MNEQTDFTPGVVYFAGAGPGEPELLTLKTRRLIENAELILYAGSLVNPDILAWASRHTAKIDTAGLKLEEQVRLMTEAARSGKIIARLHTGDPAIFGAVNEQAQALQRAGISYEIIPGVSSAFAAAAALGIEYTIPGITQTVIFTRLSGQTPVPVAEDLRELASHHCSLVIFLSMGMLEIVVEKLVEADYPASTAVAVVYRASWPDQKIVRGTMETISGLVGREELTHQGLIIVSPALEASQMPHSHLYSGFQKKEVKHKGTAILALTLPSVKLGRKLLGRLPEAHLYLPERWQIPEDLSQPDIHPFKIALRQVLQNAFREHASLVCIMAAGVVMRELAPLLMNKHSDPAVVVLDSQGRFAVSLLGGHEGGANRLAQRLAAITGGQAVVTTASDSIGLPALDEIARQNGWALHPRSRLAPAMAAIVNDEQVALVLDEDGDLGAESIPIHWAGVFRTWEEAASAGFSHCVVISCRSMPDVFWSSIKVPVVFHPPALVVGIGCNRGAASQEISSAIEVTFREASLAMDSIACITTIEDKQDEFGLLEACRPKGWEVRFISRSELLQIKDIPTPSVQPLKALGVWGVAEPAAMVVSGATRLLVEKRKFPNVTVAVARKGSNV